MFGFRPRAPVDEEERVGQGESPQQRQRALAWGALIWFASGLILFHPALSGRVLGSHVSGPPLSHGESPRPELGDIERAILPFLCHTAREYANGRVPLWNPFAGSGVPHLGNQQSAVLHPFTLLALILPWRLALTLRAMLFWTLCYAGTWLLARRLGLPCISSAVAAAGYALSGATVTWLCFPLGACFSHLPLMLALGIAHARRGGSLLAAALAGTLASSILAGHFEYLPLLWAITAAAWLFCAPPGRRRRFSEFAIAGVAAVGTTAIMLLPCAEYLGQSMRMQARGRHVTAFASADARMLRSLVDPRGILASGDPASGVFAPYYVGVLAPGLAILGLVSRRPRGLLIASLGAILITFENPISRLLYSVPPFTLIRAERVVVPAALCLSLAAAFGVSSLERAGARKWLPALALLLLLVERAAMTQGLNAWLAPARLYPATPLVDVAKSQLGADRLSGLMDLFPPNEATVYGVRDVRTYDAIGTSRYDLPFWAEGTHAYLGRLIETPSPLTQAAAARLVLLPATSPARTIERNDTSESLPEMEDEVAIAQEVPPGMGFVMGLSFHVASSPPGVACHALVELRRGSMWGKLLWQGRIRPRWIPRVGWMNVAVEPPFWIPPRYRVWLVIRTAGASPGASFALSAGPRNAGHLLVGGRSDSRGLAFHVLYGTPLAEIARAPDGLRLLADPYARPRARLEGGATGTARITVDDPTRTAIDIVAKTPGRLVVADTSYPGWRATLDGRPADLDAANMWRAVAIPPGTHQVVMAYRPESYRLGAFLTAMTLLSGAAAAASRFPIRP